MFKIGDFSRLAFVTTQALRYYDEIGLLKPVKVDRFTGYRYYSTTQLPRLNYILALKDLGLSLDEISLLVKDNLTLQQMRDIFILKRSELQQQASDIKRRLDRVEKLLLQLEQEGKMSDYQVVIKKVPSLKIVSIRGTVPTYHDIMQLGEKLYPVYEKHADKFAGPFLTIYHDMEYREKDVDMEVGIPISNTFEVEQPLVIRDLPGIEHAATTIHKGSYDTVGEAYQALTKWCESNGYELDGPDREVYLTGPADVDSPADYVTELQQPIKKA